MKTEFQTNRDEFLKLATKCAQAANRKSALPVLANLLVEVDGDKVTLTSSDLFMVISGSLPVAVKEPGGFLVPAKEFIERIRAMPSGALLTIREKDLEVTLRAKGSARRFKLHSLTKEDYPDVSQFDEEAESVTLPKLLLAELIAGTHYAVSTDETRTGLNSALFELEQERARMVATDGHRLAKRELPCDYSGVAKRALIPRRGVEVLRKLVDEAGAEETITLQIGAFHLFAESGITFSIRLADAAFPPYEQVIPKVDGLDPWVVNKGALVDALKAVGVSANSKTNGVRLAFSDGKVEISTESPDGGDALDEVACDGGGKRVMFGVAVNYLLDAFSEIADPQVAITVTGELDPLLVRAADGEPENLDVIMPMRM